MTRETAKAAFDAARAEVALRTAEEEEATRRLDEANKALWDARAALIRADAHVWIERCREVYPTPPGARERVSLDPRTDAPLRSLVFCEGRTPRGSLRMRVVAYEPASGSFYDPPECTWVGIRTFGERRWTVRAGDPEWHELKAALDAVEVER